MHYLLGLRNILRYITEYKLLSEKYNSTEIKSISSLRERSQLSLSSYLQGLYPQNKNLGENLNNDSLPNSMVFISLEVIDLLNLKDCRGDGSLNIKSIYDIVNEFNEKYKDKFNQFKDIERAKNL